MVSQLRGNFPLQLYFAIVMSDANWGIDRPVRQSSSFLARQGSFKSPGWALSCKQPAELIVNDPFGIL
jgi:hypothetical protein